MLSNEELMHIRGRAERASEGPWTFDEDRGLKGPDRGYTCDCGLCYGSDAIFIAASRTDIPRLLDEVERLKAEREERHCNSNGWQSKSEGLWKELLKAREENAKLRRTVVVVKAYLDARGTDSEDCWNEMMCEAIAALQAFADHMGIEK